MLVGAFRMARVALKVAVLLAVTPNFGVVV